MDGESFIIAENNIFKCILFIRKVCFVTGFFKLILGDFFMKVDRLCLKIIEILI